MITPKNKKCVECGREDQPHFSKKRCKSCAQRSYSKKTSEQNINKRKPIKPISDKKAEELKKYRRLRDEYMKINPMCEVIGCNKEGSDLHHKLHIRYGEALCDVDWFMSVCRSHHNQIHDNPKWAVENGYLADAETKNNYFNK